MTYLYYLDLFGTFVFAISGILAAVEKKFDIVGAFVLGLATAIGGGSLRDMLIGATPVGWMQDINYIIVVFIALIFCYFFKDKIATYRKSFFLFDTIGIALFTILGLNKTLALGLSPLVAILMGIVSAVFGGIIRDVLSNEVPLIFRREIYASACLAGAIVYLGLMGLFGIEPLSMGVSMLVVIAIRVLAVKGEWAVPFNVR